MGAAAAVAGIGAVGSIAGGLMSKKGSSQSGTVNNTPWGPQQPYLTGGFQDAQNIYNADNAIGPYQGSFVAGPNDYQHAAETSANNFAGGAGSTLPGQAALASQPLISGAGNFDSNANRIATNGIPGMNSGLFGTLNGFGTGTMSAGGPGPELSSALNTSAVNGANALTNFTKNLSNLGTTAGQDPTQRITQDAGAIADSPALRQQIAATNAMIDQTNNEQIVPGLNRQAAMGGSLNSSRAGAAEAQANEAASLAKGNADANIINNAYNTGVNSAGNLYATGLNAGINANTSGLFDVGLNTNNEANREQGLNEFNAGNELSAANAGLNTGLNYELGNANTELAANGQLGTGVGLGLTAGTTAGNEAANNFNLFSGAGALQQAGDQTALTNAQDQWQMNTQFPWQNLKNYWSVVGQPAGNTQSSTVQNSGPGPIAGALGGGLGAIGLYQNLAGSGLFGGSNNSGYTNWTEGSSMGADGQLYNNGGIF